MANGARHIQNIAILFVHLVQTITFDPLVEITLLNQVFEPLPHKALWWKAQSTLLLSDLHLGKIAHFRKAGIALPQQGMERNYAVLDELLDQTRANRIFFLGDLFHSDFNAEWDRFLTWRKAHASVWMAIILGNHDILPLSIYQQAGLETIHNEWFEAGFCFRHHPLESTECKNEYVISGHVHPCFRLQGRGRQSLKFPCFYFGKEQAILPSFGHFTGGFAIEPKAGETVVCVAKNELVRINL